MLTINYSNSDFEKSALAALQSKENLSVKFKGWRKTIVAKGLVHYILYRKGHRGRALMVIPFGFITPTFWNVCIRAEFQGVIPQWKIKENELIVTFSFDRK